MSKPIDRMNLLDVTKEMITEAEESSDPAARGDLVKEARQLLKKCHEILERRNAAERRDVSIALLQDLRATERRIVVLETQN